MEIGEDLFADDVDINDDAFERLHLLPRAAVEEFFLSGGVLHAIRHRHSNHHPAQ